MDVGRWSVVLAMTGVAVVAFGGDHDWAAGVDRRLAMEIRVKLGGLSW